MGNVIVFQRINNRRDCPLVPLFLQVGDGNLPDVVHRHFDKAHRERVQSYHKTAAYQKAIRKRKVWVEPLFAEAKEWHGLYRFRLRRLWRVNIEASLIGAGQNLKRLLSKKGWGRRPFPNEAAITAKTGQSILIWISCIWYLIHSTSQPVVALPYQWSD